MNEKGKTWGYFPESDCEMVLVEEIRALRLLEKNLRSGVIVNISPELVELLMKEDWTNG